MTPEGHRTRFRDQPIRRKLLLMTLASSAVSVALAGSGFLAWDVLQFRTEIRNEMRAQAQIVAENSGAPLTFRDERAAQETLGVLSFRPQVDIACLYTTTGEAFATYHRDARFQCPDRNPAASYGWDHFDVTANVLAVITDGNSSRNRVGSLYIRRNLDDLYSRLRIGGATVIGVLLVAIIGGFLIAARIQRVIVAPLLHLADTVRTISAGRDYSLRAVPSSDDEVGIVVRAFNDMLDRITERTSELSRANVELGREVEERRRVEAERTAALERERDANRLKDEFLATLSHELRTPLNAVLGWTRVLRATRVEPATEQRALESIERNARAQARLIEDLLEISRIVTGRLRLQVRDADLAAIVDAAVEVVMPAAAAKHLRLSIDIEPRPAMTMGDPDRLQQVIWNLLSNAVKFTPPDGHVSVRLERAQGYHVTVTDNGPGIDAKFLPFVFEPFRQADGTASREHGGLGLGLAIAKQLVELHGGTIHVHSDGRGTGATFELRLPSVVMPAATKTSDDRPVATLPPPATIESTLLTNVRVLVVDDEEDARLLLRLALTQFGADVATASNAADAFAEIGRHPPAVLLSDIGMPHEDGYSLIRRVRTELTFGSQIIAVALTAYATEQDRTDALAAGFHEHVAKPFEPYEVASLVARLTKARAQS